LLQRNTRAQRPTWHAGVIAGERRLADSPGGRDKKIWVPRVTLIYQKSHVRKGHSKKKVTDLDVYLIYFRGTNQPPIFFSSLFFLVRFWAFLGKGSSKTPYKYFYKKAMSKTFSEKILRKPTKISISVFPQLFLFYRVFRCFLAMGVQKHYKKRFTSKLCRKVFQNNRPKKSKPTFSRFFFNHVFGRFSVRGVQKHDKKISKKNLTNPGTFLAPEEPTNHVKVRHFCF
jgi:hypothetical protein